MREWGRVEGGEVYETDGETQRELAADKKDLCALRESQWRVLRRGLHDAVGARRAVMVGIALGRVGVQRLGSGVGSRGRLCSSRRGIVAVGVSVAVSMFGLGRKIGGGGKRHPAKVTLRRRQVLKEMMHAVGRRRCQKK